MILENLEVLTRKIRFAAEVRILSFFYWKHCFGKYKNSAHGSSQRIKVCFCTVNFTQTQMEYLSEKQTTTGTQSAPITSTEKPWEPQCKCKAGGETPRPVQQAIPDSKAQFKRNLSGLLARLAPHLEKFENQPLRSILPGSLNLLSQEEGRGGEKRKVQRQNSKFPFQAVLASTLQRWLQVLMMLNERSTRIPTRATVLLN